MKTAYTRVERMRDIVVFDSVLATLPTGASIDVNSAKERFLDGIVPAGTMIVLDTTHHVYRVYDEKIKDAGYEYVGLTYYAIDLKRESNVSVVTIGSARFQALPNLEQKAKDIIKTCLPSIKLTY